MSSFLFCFALFCFIFCALSCFGLSYVLFWFALFCLLCFVSLRFAVLLFLVSVLFCSILFLCALFYCQLSFVLFCFVCLPCLLVLFVSHILPYILTINCSFCHKIHSDMMSHNTFHKTQGDNNNFRSHDHILSQKSIGKHDYNLDQMLPGDRLDRSVSLYNLAHNNILLSQLCIDFFQDKCKYCCILNHIYLKDKIL